MRRLEIPPSGGLPLQWRDLLPARAAPLASRLACIIGAEQALVTCSGTAALVAALTTLAALDKTGARREVVIPAFTCPLVALAVIHCGLTPRLCDLRPDHFDMDPETLARLCNERTLAVLPTHLGGRLADVATAMRSAQRAGAWTIEDAAQAFGARHADGVAAGLAGDLGIFSLAAGKGLTLFEGGALVTRHRNLHVPLQQAVAATAQRRRLWEWRRCVELLGYAALYHPRRLQWVYGRPLRRALRRGDVERATGDVFPATIPLHRVGTWRQGVGARASTRLPAHLQMLRMQAAARLPMLRAIDGVRVFGDPASGQGTWPVLLVLLRDRATRDAALAQLWPAGVGVSRLFAHALTDTACLRGIVAPIDTPNARDFAARSMTISNSPWLDAATFKRIVDTLAAVCRRSDA